MSGIPAGQLNRRIDIEVASKLKDAAHDIVSTWVHFTRRSAKVVDFTGREVHGAQQQVREFDRKITLRADNGTKQVAPESYRIIYKDRIHEIVAIAESREWDDALDFLCTTRPDQVGARAPIA